MELLCFFSTLLQANHQRLNTFFFLIHVALTAAKAVPRQLLPAQVLLRDPLDAPPVQQPGHPSTAPPPPPRRIRNSFLLLLRPQQRRRRGGQLPGRPEVLLDLVQQLLLRMLAAATITPSPPPPRLHLVQAVPVVFPADAAAVVGAEGAALGLLGRGRRRFQQADGRGTGSLRGLDDRHRRRRRVAVVLHAHEAGDDARLAEHRSIRSCRAATRCLERTAGVATVLAAEC